ncbi:MAG: hypothetical protein ACJ74Z_17235 [Bryobacteraceae bacterium]
MNADEIYDSLMLCMVKAVRRYDPYYNEKVKAVAGLIEGVFHDRKKFTASDISRQLGYDGTSYVRLLSKRLFLLASGSASGETQYERSDVWPPPKAFFQSGAVGLSYVASKWFRYYLVDHINSRMSELEAKEGVFQLHTSSNSVDENENPHTSDRGIPHRFGNYTNPRTGQSVATDLTLSRMPIDIGSMTLAWVSEPQSGLLAHLSKRDRHLLYCVFARSMDWEAIAQTFDISMREAKRWYGEILISAAPSNGSSPGFIAGRLENTSAFDPALRTAFTSSQHKTRLNYARPDRRQMCAGILA